MVDPVTQKLFNEVSRGLTRIFRICVLSNFEVYAEQKTVIWTSWAFLLFMMMLQVISIWEARMAY